MFLLIDYAIEMGRSNCQQLCIRILRKVEEKSNVVVEPRRSRNDRSSTLMVTPRHIEYPLDNNFVMEQALSPLYWDDEQRVELHSQEGIEIPEPFLENKSSIQPSSPCM